MPRIMTKGNKLGKQFSSEYQPAKNGRKPAIYKQLAAMIGHTIKLELTHQDYLKIHGWLLERTVEELKQIARDPQTQTWMLTWISAIMNDIKEGKTESVSKIYDLIWKRNETPMVEINNNNINLKGLTNEELDAIGEIIEKAEKAEKATSDEPPENSETDK